jgi:ATP-binding cassette subfamily B protein
LGVLSTKAQENLTGVRVIRAYVQEKPEVASFDKANREYVQQNIQLIGTMSIFFPALTALIGLTVVVLLGMGGMQVVDGRISLGTFSAFYVFLIQLIFPMIALGWVTNIFQRGAASMGRLNYILHAEPNICDEAPSPARAPGRDGNRAGAGSAEPDSVIRGEIEFRHLTFAYPASGNGAGNGPVLRDISLHIPAGSTLAIVGPTGSGKSTLAALIARLWEAPPGTLLIDGRSIREYPLEALRRSIGYVPQDTFLFSETIRENIAFGVEDLSEEQIMEAAEIASISGEIQGFPHRFETMVGERGITLSGGQKQRTSLARAILRKPRILILDDALSSVDTDTEERILRQLRHVMRQRTTILVAHRISTVKGADRIVVLRGGEIIERGTHDELLALGGYYADLYQKQLLEEELERE